MERNLLLVSLALLLFSVRLAHAEELPVAKPAAVGMSKGKLAEVMPAVKDLVEAEKIAGAVVAVARNGHVVLLDAVGDQHREAGTPMRPDTIFRIYSMTKPVTSVAVMMLVEEGKLELDAPVSEYLPELKDVAVLVPSEEGESKTVPARRPITLRDLLRHTSGLTYGFFGNTEVDKQYRAVNVLDSASSLADLPSKLSKLPLLYQPGARFNYSVSTDLLGRVVEVASGQSLDEFFQQRIFEPLGMHDTGFSVPDDKLARFAANYGPKPAGGLRVIDAPEASRYRKKPGLLSGGGGLVSTARDYLRFCQMLLNRGQLDGKRLLKEETVEAMTRNQLPDEAYPIDLGGPRPGVGFGLGFSVVVEETPYTADSAVGEYGWGGAASTHFWISPRDQLAVVVLTQHMPFTFQAEHLVKPLVYDAIQKPE